MGAPQRHKQRKSQTKSTSNQVVGHVIGILPYPGYPFSCVLYSNIKIETEKSSGFSEIQPQGSLGWSFVETRERKYGCRYPQGVRSFRKAEALFPERKNGRDRGPAHPALGQERRYVVGNKVPVAPEIALYRSFSSSPRLIRAAHSPQAPWR